MQPRPRASRLAKYIGSRLVTADLAVQDVPVFVYVLFCLARCKDFENSSHQSEKLVLRHFAPGTEEG